MEQLMINTGDSELEVSTKKYFLFQCNYILVCHCARAPRHCALLKVVFDCRFCNRMASTTCLAVSVHIESALYKCLLQTASSPFSVNRAGELITKTSSARLERANEPRENWGRGEMFQRAPSVCISFRSLCAQIADRVFAHPLYDPGRDCQQSNSGTDSQPCTKDHSGGKNELELSDTVQNVQSKYS